MFTFYNNYPILCSHSNTPPQAGAYMLIMPSLLQKYSTRTPLSAFVKMSPIWSPVFTYEVEIKPCWIFSRTKWQSISICFVLSWKTGLDAIWMAAWLSHHNVAGKVTLKLNSVNSCCIHIISHVPWAIALYSDSALVRYTMLLLALPWDQVSSKKYAISSSWSSVYLRPSIVCICEAFNPIVTMIWV